MKILITTIAVLLFVVGCDKDPDKRLSCNCVSSFYEGVSFAEYNNGKEEVEKIFTSCPKKKDPKREHINIIVNESEKKFLVNGSPVMKWNTYVNSLPTFGPVWDSQRIHSQAVQSSEIRSDNKDIVNWTIDRTTLIFTEKRQAISLVGENNYVTTYQCKVIEGI